MIPYFFTILVIVLLLVILAQHSGLVESQPRKPPKVFWVFIGITLFMGLVVAQIG